MELKFFKVWIGFWNREILIEEILKISFVFDLLRVIGIKCSIFIFCDLRYF